MVFHSHPQRIGRSITANTNNLPQDSPPLPPDFVVSTMRPDVPILEEMATQAQIDSVYLLEQKLLTLEAQINQKRQHF